MGKLEFLIWNQHGPLSAMYIVFVQQLGVVPTPLLRFNLNVWTIIICALLLTPLAVFSAYTWPRKK